MGANSPLEQLDFYIPKFNKEKVYISKKTRTLSKSCFSRIKNENKNGQSESIRN